MKYFPHTDDDIRQMLDAIGVKSLDELYAEVPDELKLHRELNIPSAMSEIEVRKIINDLAADKAACSLCWCRSLRIITSLQLFRTSLRVVNFQPRIHRTRLKFRKEPCNNIFEYQTMMADLTGMDLSNA